MSSMRLITVAEEQHHMLKLKERLDVESVIKEGKPLP